MNGIELSRRYYRTEVAPGLAGVRHAAALLGDGSEVLGFDDEVSTDHDFGPRVQIFIPDRHTVAGFFRDRLGFDPGAGVRVADWLLTPTQILAGLTRGAVFHDPDGELARYRAALAWYPDDVWRYALAAGWLKVAQEEAFIGRTGSTGDHLGSQLVTARLARELVRLAFLVERRWAPYGKWLGRACTELTLSAEVGPLLSGALGAAHWRQREQLIGTAGGIVAAATNTLGLAPAVDPAPRQFYDRDIRVLGADRFTVALCREITDPVLRAVIDRVGRRAGVVGRLPGTIDQAADSTDVLTSPARFRAAAPMLGLATTD
ncbi:MAG TPA: DUF4037 domain-containing protein [Actinoplanes sp.]|nr:DUF4037 domain-containing protein [Actinoplanes sp.]